MKKDKKYFDFGNIFDFSVNVTLRERIIAALYVITMGIIHKIYDLRNRIKEKLNKE